MARLVKFRCAQCGAKAQREASHVNRARTIGAGLYCNRACAGLHRRTDKTLAEKRAAKREYDKSYRAKNLAEITAKKAARFQRTYDPAAARIERRKRAAAHAEYCRRPEYKAWKQGYDRQRRAKEYGPFAEAYRLSIDLNREIKSRSSNHEIRQANGTGNKTIQRDREAKGPKRGLTFSTTHRRQSQGHPVGDAE